MWMDKKKKYIYIPKCAPIHRNCKIKKKLSALATCNSIGPYDYYFYYLYSDNLYRD